MIATNLWVECNNQCTICCWFDVQVGKVFAYEIIFFLQRLYMDVGSLMEKSIDRSASVPSHQLHSIAIKYKRLDIWSVCGEKRKKKKTHPLYKWLPLDFTSWSRCHSTWVTFYSIFSFLDVSHHWLFRMEIAWILWESVRLASESDCWLHARRGTCRDN